MIWLSRWVALCALAGALVLAPDSGRAAEPRVASARPEPTVTPVAEGTRPALDDQVSTRSVAPPALLPPALVPPASAAAPTSRGLTPPESASLAVLLLDDASGTVLFERNGHQTLPPASLTKIATAIVALEGGALDAPVDIDVDSRTMRGSTVMGLEPGDRFSLRDLLYGLMLPSGNDAAIAIGRHVSGSDLAFVDAMNAMVSRLGLRESHFSNPHGLAGIGHYASAYDLAMLSRYAMTVPGYREIASADRWVARGSREITMFSLVTEERWRTPGVDAGKSGYTRSAGRTLVLSAERDGHRLHAVVLNDQQTEAVSAALLEWGFANFEWPAAATVAAAS